MSEAVLNLLRTELFGPHGDSERRAVAEFVHEAVTGDPSGPTAEDLAHSLADAACGLAARLRAIRLGLPDPREGGP